MTRRVLDVRAFGAVGDGRTDDQPAIVRALFEAFVMSGWGIRRKPRFDADGAIVVFPPGRYRIAAPLEWMFRYDRLSIIGAGRDATTLVFDQGDGFVDPAGPHHLTAVPRLAAGGHPGHEVRDLSISDLTITTVVRSSAQPVRAMGAAALSVGWCRGVRITNVDVGPVPNTGLYLYHCTDVIIEDSTIHHVNLDGIHVSRSHGVTVRNCRIHDTGDDGIGVSGTAEQISGDVAITDNQIIRSGSSGVALFGVDGAVVASNEIRDTFMCGVVVRAWPGCEGTHHVEIRDNRIDGAGLYPSTEQPPEAPLWGGGTPYGIAVANDTPDDPLDPHHVAVTLGPVSVVGNHIGACRNSFVAVRRAEGVTVTDNEFAGPLDSSPRLHDGGEGGAYLEGSGVYAPPAPHGGVPQVEDVAIRVRDGSSITIERNTSPGSSPDVWVDEASGDPADADESEPASSLS